MAGSGARLLARLGLPEPVPLDRWAPGSPVVDGTVVLGAAPGSPPGGELVEPVAQQLEALGVRTVRELRAGEPAKGLVLDASGIGTVAGLGGLADFCAPLMRRLAGCSRIVVLGTPPEQVDDTEAAVAQRALEGFTRSVGKELRRGGTAQLVLVAPAAVPALTSTLAFLLSPRSAYVSGQVIRVGSRCPPGGAPIGRYDPQTPLAGRVALVTGAARGIGAEVCRVLARDGATVVGVDLPAVASPLQALATELGADPLVLDVAAPDAAQRIARHVRDRHDRLDVLVHNAGITSDRRLANMRPDAWDPVLRVNLGAPVRITEHLLAEDVLGSGAAVVGVSSIAGISGNDGQTSYATSKAGVIGLVDALAPRTTERGVTVNAVAPGFIETAMTAAMPMLARQAGRRLNSLGQGGLPVDVAETIGWLAAAGSAAVSGNVVRVCGQSVLGA